MAASTRVAVHKVAASSAWRGNGATLSSVEAAVSLAALSWCPTAPTRQSEICSEMARWERERDACKTDAKLWDAHLGRNRSIVEGCAAKTAPVGRTPETQTDNSDAMPGQREVPESATKLWKLFGDRMRPHREHTLVLWEPLGTAHPSRLAGTVCEDIRADSVKRKRKKKMNKHKHRKRRKLDRHKNT